MPENQWVIFVPEAARMLGVSKQTIYDQIKRGKLPGILISDRRYCIPRKSFMDILANGNNGYGNISKGGDNGTSIGQ